MSPAFPGQTALSALLAGLSPQLWAIPRIIRAQAPDAALPPHAIVVVREAEGTTVVESVADHAPADGEPDDQRDTNTVNNPHGGRDPLRVINPDPVRVGKPDAEPDAHHAAASLAEWEEFQAFRQWKAAQQQNKPPE